MLFSVSEFNGLLGQMQRFMWRQATACPCVNAASGAANTACPICNGKGYIWGAETACIAGMQNMRNERSFAMFGEWQAGDVLFTVGSDSPLYAARQFDRIRCLNAASPFSTIIVPGANDKLSGTISAISRVFWISDGTTVVDGDIPTVNSDGSLSWVDGQAAPPADTQYSVSGIRFDEFYLYRDIPGNRNDDLGAALPRKFPARRFDLLGR